MGIVADAALAQGGEVIGVIPHKLYNLELGHEGLTELHLVDGMHPRKKKMAELSDGFIALPGGWGTMEELAEVTTWTQLNDHMKPVGVLNVNGYYDHLLAWVSHALGEGFIRPHHKHLLQDSDTPEGLLHALQNAQIPLLSEWLNDGSL